MTRTFNRAVTAIGISAIREFDARVSNIPGIIKLTLGEPNFNTPEHIKQVAIKAIENNHSHYEHMAGIFPLRQAAAKYYNEKFNLTYSPQQVITTVGATEGILASLMTVLNPGEKVIIPTPIFPPYITDTTLVGGEPILIDTSQSNYLLDPSVLEDILSKDVDHLIKAVILVFPSNPTGATYTREHLIKLAEVIKKYDIWAICDEIYAELMYDREHTSMGEILPEHTILLTGLSKSHAMTGWRIGFIMGPLHFIDEVIKPHQFMVTTPTVISQHAALQALTYGQDDCSQMMVDYRKRRDFMKEALQTAGFTIVQPDGAFYLFAKIPEQCIQNSWDFAYDLAKMAKVAVIPGDAFGPGGSSHIRISYAASMDDLQEAANRIQEYVNALK
ncbi:aminotransferase class I/II-fold pyridoxal phosphate-dependent enzyme [Carnobacteriaceae bacterium zg-ZUI252]|nr:aminotransferase class I/II-fold pyridoxal phosphate-dependent enzyme [Carnobacteriaceae bacterium zg-ZUI252]MBS4770236.1 aminotransferase class I/II-fold pyridoxal phosphate-dependent enzyme [Carnobacteriaceae bacterium zg-ZUI240]QTU83406.1 aminotransferase class I/II-fold pyridoxal phosphate-dependent enzyme [Carnobacteriaceae bacterium zg-C25]